MLDIEWIKEDPTYNSVTKLPTRLQRVFHSIDQKNGPSGLNGLKDSDEPLYSLDSKGEESQINALIYTMDDHADDILC